MVTVMRRQNHACRIDQHLTKLNSHLRFYLEHVINMSRWNMVVKNIKWGALLLVMMPFAASAQDLEFNGFLSVSAGTLSNEDLGDYRGYDEEWNTDPDTTFGLQVSSNLTEKVTATAQVIARGIDDYDIEAEWAYLTYSINDRWDIKLGKLRNPYYFYSDFLEVGYAYPWITPPVRTYGLPFADFAGIDTNYTHPLGDLESNWQLLIGRHESTLDGDVDIDLKNLAGLYWTVSGDWFTARVGGNYAKANLQSPALDPLFGGLEAVGFGAVADQLDIVDDQGIFWDIAFNVDHNDWLFHAEYTYSDRDEESLLARDSSYLVMLGRRWNDFTFHISWNDVDSEIDRDFINNVVIAANVPNAVVDGVLLSQGVPAAGIPAVPQAQRDLIAAAIADPLRAGANAAIFAADQTDITIGIRYDFAPGTAVKVELVDISDDIRDEDGTLFAISVDMVF